MRDSSRPFARLVLRVGALGVAGTTFLVPLHAGPPQIGLSGARARLVVEEGILQNAPGASDFFGFSVAAGDFDRNGIDDLAIGVPTNDCNGIVWDCGAVQVRYGFADFLGGPQVLSPLINPNDPADAFDQYGRALATGDFNRDGHDDLAVGVPSNAPQTSNQVDGAVMIHYGLTTAMGSLQFVPEHMLAQGVGGVPQEGVIAPTDADNRFGHALAVGDFDGDGHDDLAASAPWAETSSHELAGNVIVAHGHLGGLAPFSGFLMKQGLNGLPDTPEGSDEFGDALAAADFDGDGIDDLAIGVPGEDGVGAVIVVYGSRPSSLDFANHQFFGHWDLDRLPQPGSRFGATLAAGDFDGDGYADLAVGAPDWDTAQGEPDAGLVTVIYGSAGRLQVPGELGGHVEWFAEDTLASNGASESRDRFGSALAAGDFDGDGHDDLAIGARGEYFQDVALSEVGAVTVVLGRPAGLVGPARMLSPNRTFAASTVIGDGLIPDHKEGGPWYGTSLAVGDFDGSGIVDLAIGAPRRSPVTPDRLTDAGAVAILFNGRIFADGFEGGDAAGW